MSRTRPAARRWARLAALLGSTAALALLGGTVVPPASATTVTPKAAMIRPHFGAAAHTVGTAPTVAARVAAIDAVTATLPSVTTAYGVPALWNQGITGAAPRSPSSSRSVTRTRPRCSTPTASSTACRRANSP